MVGRLDIMILFEFLFFFGQGIVAKVLPTFGEQYHGSEFESLFCHCSLSDNCNALTVEKVLDVFAFL